MTVAEAPVKHAMDGFAYLALDTKYDGSCPCATFEVEGTQFRAHCWRTCSRCTYAGLHYEGDVAVARRVMRAFRDMEWGQWSMRRGLS